jgi:hypothetical protein
MLKKTALLILLCFCATWGQSQTTLITENFSDVRLTKAFRILEKKYGLRIGYDVKLIKKKTVNANLSKKTPQEAFTILLQGTGLDFSISGGTYIAIYPEQKKSTGIAQPTPIKQYYYQGWVYDEENQETIPFAKVRVLGTNIGSYADDDGKFSLSTNRAVLKFEVSALGYKKRILGANELSDRNGFKIKLEVDVKDFPEIVVEYLAEGMTVSRDISVLDIRPRRFGATSGTVDPDVFINLQNVPGVNSANGTVSEMQIRGGTSDQNLILWEGITLYHSGHLNGMISSINPYTLDRAQVYRGVYDPYFGGRASGLIDMSSLSSIPSKVEAGAGINLVAADAFVKMPIKKNLGLMVSGRRSYVGAVNTPTYQQYANRLFQETELRQTGEVYDETFADSLVILEEVQNSFEFNDINAKLRYEPTEKSTLSASFIYTNNELFYNALQIEDSTVNQTEFRTKNIGSSIEYSKKWNTRWKSDVSVAFSDYDYRYFERFASLAEEEMEELSVLKLNRILTLGWRWKNSWRLNETNTLTFGYQGDYFDVNASVEESEDSVTVYAESLNTKALLNVLHANHEWKQDKWLIRTGARATHYSELNKVFVDPRLYAQYMPSKLLTFKTGASVLHQFISQVEDLDQAQLGLSNRIWVLSEEGEVPVTNSWNVNAGFLLRWKGWHFEVDGYLKQINGISNFADDKTMSSGFERGVADVRGVDFLVMKRWKGWRTWLSYTLSDVEYWFEDDTLAIPFAAPYNQPHVVKAITTLNWKNWEGAVTFKVASGKPYTRLIGLAENPDGTIGGDLDDDFILNYDQLNGAELPIYHRLDLSIFYTVRSKNIRYPWSLKMGVSFLNIYDQANYLSRTYRLEVNENEQGDEEVETVTIDRYYLRFTPNATVRLEWGK